MAVGCEGGREARHTWGSLAAGQHREHSVSLEQQDNGVTGHVASLCCRPFTGLNGEGRAYRDGGRGRECQRRV